MAPLSSSPCTPSTHAALCADPRRWYAGTTGHRRWPELEALIAECAVPDCGSSLSIAEEDAAGAGVSL